MVLLETVPQLRVAITQGKRNQEESLRREEKIEKQEEETGEKKDTLFTIGTRRTPAVVEMEIMGCKLSNTIVDGGSGVNVLPEETWKALGKPTL